EEVAELPARDRRRAAALALEQELALRLGEFQERPAPLGKDPVPVEVEDVVVVRPGREDLAEALERRRPQYLEADGDVVRAKHLEEGPGHGPEWDVPVGPVGAGDDDEDV